MKDVFKGITNTVIILSLLGILLGIVFAVYPDASLAVLGVVVALYLIISGAGLIILDIRAWRLYIPFDGMLLGILSVVLGVLLMKNPDSISVYIGIVMGVWIIFSGFTGIRTGAALRWTVAPWESMIVMGIIDIIIGGLVLYSPVLSSISLTIGIGVILIIHSVINIIYMIMLKRNAKEFEKLITEKMQELNIDEYNE